MRIYGKTFTEIYDELPLPYKIIVVACISYNIFVALYLAANWLKPEPPKKGEPVLINGMNMDMGALDPSVDIDPNNKKSVMAFTKVETEGSNVWLVMGDGECHNWASTGNPVFLTQSDELFAPNGEDILAGGSWFYETPSVVYDADDKEKPWKLFAYRYFWSKPQNLSLARRYSIIVTKTAASPAGPWSEEKWLFSAAPDFPPPPYQNLISLQLNSLSPDLANMLFYSRPSVLYQNGALLMTLSAFKKPDTVDRVILLVSTDHGTSWGYVGTLMTEEDASKMGPYTRLSGATLMRQDGGIYLAAVLGDAERKGLGTFILGFDDVTKAQLKKDPSTGAPAILKFHDKNSVQPTMLGGGYAAYNAACKDGMYVAEISGVKQSFQIFKTYHRPIE